MAAVDIMLEMAEPAPAVPRRVPLRFERVAITSIWGDPLAPGTWSGAPANLAAALQQHGVVVEGIAPRLDRSALTLLATRHLLRRHAVPSLERVLRSAAARRRHAATVAEAAARRGFRDVLHTGTLDMPALMLPPGIRHYLYCDQTWDLSLRHRPDADRYDAREREDYECLERAALHQLTHIFTFGRYVRDNMITHYGLSPDRVTAVGSGMGAIAPWNGAKSYAPPRLLFVAKHLFLAKGGRLVVDAFLMAQRQRPDLTLTIVGDARSRRFVPKHPGITFHDHLPWAALQQLYREASLLVEPMINDPWGQVYLEALLSRTPPIGLDRNGLPEIIGGGKYGFLAPDASATALAATILDASSDPDRLATMAEAGQRHMLSTYSWERTAERIAFG